MPLKNSSCCLKSSICTLTFIADFFFTFVSLSIDVVCSSELVLLMLFSMSVEHVPGRS